MPRQMPKSGFLVLIIKSRKLYLSTPLITAQAVPTPGSTRRSAVANSLVSEVTTAS